MTKFMRRFMKPDPRECEAVQKLMSDYVDADLADAERTQVDDHVGICPACRRVLGNLRITLERVGLLSGNTPGGAEPTEDVAARITQNWRERL